MLQMIVTPQIIEVTPLTQSEFGIFGCVVENPTTANSNGSSTDNPALCPQPLPANQGTALKYPNISTMEDLYKHAPQHRESKPTMNIFVCSPRPLISINNQDYPTSPSKSSSAGFLDLSIMERHPYTTQTFIPLGLDPRDTSTAYLVVVAPNIPSLSEDAGLPDTVKTRAFLARGSQAVTYGAGTWHAPMIVLGGKAVVFVAVQHVNGNPRDDCEEINIICTQHRGLRLRIPFITKSFHKSFISKL